MNKSTYSPIPFNKPYLINEAEEYVLDSLRSGSHCGNNKWNKKCINLLKEKYGFGEIFLVPSGTAALEMGVMLAGIGPGDEVIMPSYTFSSTATSVLMCGGIPVFCEIEPGSMNIDPNYIERLITKKTKMIVPIDYAGIPCDLRSINLIAEKHNLFVMVDAAQSLNSKDQSGGWVGTSTPLAAFSFHETKNFGCGEGGALVVNRPEWVQRAHFLQEKGTDRRLVLDGVKSKYGWVDKGSSYLLSDVLAAMLYAQLEKADEITKFRERVTVEYHRMLKPFEDLGFISTPKILGGCIQNHHAFFILLDSNDARVRFLNILKNNYNVNAYIGYVPLHSSTKGLELGYKPEDLPLTENFAARIVRLPLFADLGKSDADLKFTVEAISKVLSELYPLGN
jgi:dTDP-4-amino-4,6-dideoxygalactose transaminase